MTLAQTSFRQFHLTQTLVGLLLLVVSIAVAMGVFSANLANLDGILFGVAALPCALALLLIAEAERDHHDNAMGLGAAIALAGAGLIAWSAFNAWEVAEQFGGGEGIWFAIEFLPFASTGMLLIISGAALAGVIKGRHALAIGVLTGIALVVASLGAAVGFATHDAYQDEGLKTFLAAVTVPLAFSIFVIASSLRFDGGLRAFPYLPAGFALILMVAIPSAIWSAGTAEHFVFGDFIGAPPPPPDVTMSERLYAFSRLAIFPVTLGMLVLLSGPYRRGMAVFGNLVLLLAIGFAGWSASDPSTVPVPSFSGWTGSLPVSSAFWIFLGNVITPVAVYVLVISRAGRSAARSQ